MTRIVWLHDEALSEETKALTAHPDAPAIFVFDDEWIRDERPSLGRIVFVYECLLDLPVEIHRGDVIESLRAFAARHGADEIVAPATEHPRLRRQGEALGVRWIETEPFVRLDPNPGPDPDPNPDLRRFSRYWRRAKHKAFVPTSEQ